MDQVCVALKSHIGWVNAVAVQISAASPVPCHAERINLLDGDAHEVVEPYHVTGGWQGLTKVPRPKNPLLSSSTPGSNSAVPPYRSSATSLLCC